MINKETNYRRFLFNVVVFLAIVLLFDQLVGRTLKQLYFTSKSGVNYLTTYSMDSTMADIVILGSSRASHHYEPVIIEDSLNMTCFNTGRDGTSIFYNYGIFCSIIKRYSPKLLILDVNPDVIYTNTKTYEDLSVLLPYYHSNPEIKTIFTVKGELEKLKMMSSIYPYNSTLLAILTGQVNSTSDVLVNKGFLPLESVMKFEVLKTTSKKLELQQVDQNVISILTKMAEKCKEKGIRLLLIQSPRYLISKQSKANSVVAKIVSKYGFSYLNLSNDSGFMAHPNYFADVAHLNKTGASIFTNQVVKSISGL